jgi:hypothetical protein
MGSWVHGQSVVLRPFLTTDSVIPKRSEESGGAGGTETSLCRPPAPEDSSLRFGMTNLPQVFFPLQTCPLATLQGRQAYVVFVYVNVNAPVHVNGFSGNEPMNYEL